MECGLHPFQVKAVCIGGASFVVFVHVTSAESHKERTSFLCKQGKKALPEPTHMEPGRFQFAVTMFEGEMEVETFWSPVMHPPDGLAGGALTDEEDGISQAWSGGEPWKPVSWRSFEVRVESSGCASVIFCFIKKSTQS